LFVEWRKREAHTPLISEADVLSHVGLPRYFLELNLELTAKHPEEQEARPDHVLVKRTPKAQLRRIDESRRV
jgi:hypothetical protein